MRGGQLSVVHFMRSGCPPRAGWWSTATGDFSPAVHRCVHTCGPLGISVWTEVSRMWIEGVRMWIQSLLRARHTTPLPRKIGDRGSSTGLSPCCVRRVRVDSPAAAIDRAVHDSWAADRVDLRRSPAPRVAVRAEPMRSGGRYSGHRDGHAEAGTPARPLNPSNQITPRRARGQYRGADRQYRGADRSGDTSTRGTRGRPEGPGG